MLEVEREVGKHLPSGAALVDKLIDSQDDKLFTVTVKREGNIKER